MMPTITRHRILLAAAIYTLLGELPVVISMFSPNWGTSIGPILGFSLFGLIPICGIYAFIGARRELNSIKGSLSTPDLAAKMRLIAITSASGTIIWLPLAAMIILSFFTFRDTFSPREEIINNFNNISANAYQYTLRLSSSEGRLTTFEGYSIPKRMQEWSYGDKHFFHYKIVSLYPDSIVIEARYENDIKGAVRATVGSNSQLTNWHYYGDLDY